MPNYFQFKDKEGTPIPLSKLDDDLCAVVGVEPDSKSCHPAFEFSIQTAAAIGWSVDKMVEEFSKYDYSPDNEALKMAQWLKDQGITCSAWYQPR